jgi:hypothetical protein
MLHSRQRLLHLLLIRVLDTFSILPTHCQHMYNAKYWKGLPLLGLRGYVAYSPADVGFKLPRPPYWEVSWGWYCTVGIVEVCNTGCTCAGSGVFKQTLFIVDFISGVIC